MCTDIRLQRINFRQRIRTLKLKQPQATETMLIDALVLFLTDHCAEAVAQLTALLKMDPDNQRAQMLRSRAKILQKLDANAASLYQSGRWSDAVAKWGEVLQVFQFSQNASFFVLTDV